MMNYIRPKQPAYHGCPQQPKNSGGLFSQLLCYLFGGGTPAYKGTGQTVSKACGVPGFPGTPAYQTPEIVTDDTEEPALGTSEGDDVNGYDESDKYGSQSASTPMQTMGPITIVVG